VHICKSYCEKISGTFLCGHGVYHQTFSPSGNHTIFVFRTKHHDNIPTVTPPPNWSVECRRGINQYLDLSRNWYTIR